MARSSLFTVARSCFDRLSTNGNKYAKPTTLCPLLAGVVRFSGPGVEKIKAVSL